MQPLWTAATGLRSGQFALDTIGHNLANINSTGFKGRTASFDSLIHQEQRVDGQLGAFGSPLPVGYDRGTGVTAAASRYIWRQGSIQSTGSATHMALDGPGFFPVEGADGETRYTRDGTFRLDAKGYLVTAGGERLLDADGSPVQIPAEAQSVEIAPEGTVTVRLPEEAEPQVLTQLGVATFPNRDGLTALGSNLLAPTEASGEAAVQTPEAVGTAIRQGALEGSNVDLAESMTSMLLAQRAYQLSARAVTTADEVAQTNLQILS